MEQLGFKEQQSFSSGGTFKSRSEYNKEQQSPETFFENLKKALNIMGNKHGMTKYATSAIEKAHNMNSAKLLTRNIWILAIALLMIESHKEKALKNVYKLELKQNEKVDVIRYIRFLNTRDE